MDENDGRLWRDYLASSEGVYQVMRIKSTSAYEDMWIYNTIDVLNLLHVSASYCGHFHEGFSKDYIKKYI
jgi:hypothetical protein